MRWWERLELRAPVVAGLAIVKAAAGPPHWKGAPPQTAALQKNKRKKGKNKQRAGMRGQPNQSGKR